MVGDFKEEKGGGRKLSAPAGHLVEGDRGGPEVRVERGPERPELGPKRPTINAL